VRKSDLEQFAALVGSYVIPFTKYS
jgi:hypothetical protein